MPDREMKYDVKKFSKQLEERTKKFAISIVRLSTQIPNSPEGKVIRNQITKSGTSSGIIKFKYNMLIYSNFKF